MYQIHVPTVLPVKPRGGERKVHDVAVTRPSGGVWVWFCLCSSIYGLLTFLAPEIKMSGIFVLKFSPASQKSRQHVHPNWNQRKVTAGGGNLSHLLESMRINNNDHSGFRRKRTWSFGGGIASFGTASFVGRCLGWRVRVTSVFGSTIVLWTCVKVI